MTNYSVYFAGDLFDHKHLLGNAILAETITRRSKGKYESILPQALEKTFTRTIDIRNQDLFLLMNCDLGLFNFDGTDLDSGTVVEYVIAKILDIPSVILRSDFRNSGDQKQGGDNWNLMCSNYPRSRIIQFNAMEWYQDAIKGDKPVKIWSDKLYNRIADTIISELTSVHKIPSIFDGNEEKIRAIYEWATQFPGGNLEQYYPQGTLDKIIKSKKLKGLL